MATDEIEQQLIEFKEDYLRCEKTPFNHFFCPILFRDEDVELCMGHIINESIPGSCRARVVQRKDVDGYFGSVFESKFVDILRARGTDRKDMFLGGALGKNLRPRITVDGEEVAYYHFPESSQVPPHHCPMLLEREAGDAVRIVLKQEPRAVAAALGKRWRVELEKDGRLPAIVSLIKAAYLTLFKMLGYRYALSTAGIDVGLNILGRFYLANRDRPAAESRDAAREHFRPYVHMVRPVEYVGEMPVRGTVEDGRAAACFGSSGRAIGLIVFVRTGNKVHAVFMPAFAHPDSVSAYLDFLRSDRDTLRVCDCQFDPQMGQWEGSDQPREIVWPKNDPTFVID